MDYVDCYLCNGTGIDDANWDGRCFSCRGSGQVEAGDRDDEMADWDEEPAAAQATAERAQ
jgi:DnaJ-class molecular chaperone